MVANVLKIIGSGIYLILTTVGKSLRDIHGLSIFEFIGTAATGTNAGITLIYSLCSFLSGKYFFNKIQVSAGSVDNFYNWVKTKPMDPVSYTGFSILELTLAKTQLNFYNPIPLSSIDKKEFLGITTLSLN